jgi:hypothetical protein
VPVAPASWHDCSRASPDFSIEQEARSNVNERETREAHRRTTAFHEAAHAVVAYRLDINIGAVSIRPDVENNEAGSCAIAEWREPVPDDYVVYLFSGLEGTRLIQPGACIEDGAGDDYGKAAEVHGQDQPPPVLVQRAREMVQRDRVAIEAVAEALLEHEVLPDDSATLIVDCIDEGENWQVMLPEYLRRRGWAAQ